MWVPASTKSSSTTNPRALFVFAHQDDEYFALPWILEELAAQSAVACVYLTDGGDRVAPAVRDAETRGVLLDAGVRDDAIIFLKTGGGDRIADGDLARRSLEALAALEGWMEAASFPPTRIYAPSYEGGHPDHDVAHLVAAVVAKNRNIADDAWHFSLYNAYRRPRPFFATMRQLPTTQLTRRTNLDPRRRWAAAFTCWRYRSQWKTWLGLFPESLWRRTLIPSENVVRFELQRVNARPHRGKLLYERLFSYSYATFSECVAAIRKALHQPP